MLRTLRGSVLQRSDRTVMILAAIFAAVAAILVFVVLSNAGSDNKTSSTSAGTATVVTAAQDIAAGTRLSANMLTVTSVPTDLALARGYPYIEALVGLTTRADVVKGEQVTSSKIGQAQTNDKSLALVVPPGMRAVAIPVDEKTSVGGLILPGDVVDVIAIFSSSSGGGDRAITLLQKVPVLAVAQNAEEPVPPPVGGATPGTLGRTPDDAKAQPSAGSVTVAVPPDQAQLLALVADKAKLYLTLRPRGEDASVQLGESSLSGLGVSP